MSQDGAVSTIEPWLRQLLRCPSCGATLRDGFADNDPAAAELQCSACPLAYRIDNGIPVLLVDEARSRE
jgi:uncharacterized protein